MEKVWVVIIDDVYDYECAIDTEVFSTEEKAKAYLKEVVCDFKNTRDLQYYEIDDDTDEFYCAYLEGRYSEEHFEVSIRMREIK